MSAEATAKEIESLPVKKEVMEVLKAAVMGGLVGFILCFLMNYFFIPPPTDALGNGIANGISGAVSGCTGGWAGMAIYFLGQHRRKKNKEEKVDSL